MKIKRWKRIGIIASVVWMVGAGHYTLRAITKEDDERFEEANRMNCLPLLNHNQELYQRCVDNISYHRLSLVSYERRFAATVAVVPVPVGWGLAYLVLALMRREKGGSDVRTT